MTVAQRQKASALSHPGNGDTLASKDAEDVDVQS